MKTHCSCILLDIEGTTSSVSYVYDEMFPYVRRHLGAYLKQNWGTPELGESLQLLSLEAGLENWPDRELSVEDQQAQAAREAIRQMDSDLKTTGLKNLQGKIWKSGFESGALKSHIYADVHPALEAWKELGKDIRIYSSGSVQAQLLFFGHTTEGNLLDYFSAHYDTTIGSKKESQSYSHISRDSQFDPGRILFVSDILEELNAAKSAGLETVLSLRPGNAPVTQVHTHPVINSFAEIEWA